VKPTILLVQIILAVILIIVILIQQKGTGLGSAFGSELSLYRSRRGAEKLLFYITIISATLFVLLSLIGLALR